MPMPTNIDFQTEQDALSRRMQIAEALRNGGLAPLGPTEVVGGVAVKKSPLEGLSKIVQAYFGAKNVQSITDEQRKLGQDRRADLRSAMEQYLNASSGKLTQPGGSDLYGAQADLNPNPQQAILEALTSQHPEMRAVGAAGMKNMQQGQITAKDMLPYASPSAIPGMVAHGAAGFQPKREKPIEVGGMLLDPESLTVLKANGPPPERISIKGDLYEINPTTGQYKKLDNAPKVTVTNSMGGVILPGQKKGAETLFSEYGKRVAEMGKISQNATNNLQAIAELKNLESQGIFSNVTAGPKTFLANLGQSIGVPVDQNKLANTEGFNSVATDLWQGVVSKYGGNRGITAEEAKQLKQIIPQAANSPQARQQMYGILERVAQRQISQYQNANKSFLKAVQADDVTMLPDFLEDSQMPAPTTPNPATSGVAPKAPMSLEDYLKSRSR